MLQCDGKHLLFLYDFYSCDTLFTGDVYSSKPANDEYGYAKAYTPLTDAITYIVPFHLDCMVGLPEGKKRFVQKAKEATPYSYPYEYWLYFNSEVGLVKFEDSKHYTELISIKR